MATTGPPLLDPDELPLPDPEPLLEPELDPELDPDPEPDPLLDPELDPELEPDELPLLEPELDPELEPELDPELEPELLPDDEPLEEPESAPASSKGGFVGLEQAPCARRALMPAPMTRMVNLAAWNRIRGSLFLRWEEWSAALFAARLSPCGALRLARYMKNYRNDVLTCAM